MNIPETAVMSSLLEASPPAVNSTDRLITSLSSLATARYSPMEPHVVVRVKLGADLPPAIDVLLRYVRDPGA
jgi:hypothetical protein